LIDGIIVNIVAVVVVLLLDALTNIWVTGLFTGLLTFLYFVAFETTQGWTPGKKILGLSVHGPGGAPKPTAQQSAIRNVWTLLPIIPFIGGLLAFIAIVVTINSEQAGQARRTRRGHPGRQGLDRHITIPSSSTSTRPVTDSTVSMIDQDLMV
jgi:uncharacterized RDD family membrane protein YckC